MIYITMDGGLIQDVLSDDPEQVGQDCTVVDYDTDGEEPDGYIGGDPAFVRRERILQVNPAFMCAVDTIAEG